MPILKCYVSDEEALIIKAYATADDRTVSQLLFHAVKGNINRSKKKGSDGELINMPDKARLSRVASTRKG